MPCDAAPRLQFGGGPLGVGLGQPLKRSAPPREKETGGQGGGGGAGETVTAAGVRNDGADTAVVGAKRARVQCHDGGAEQQHPPQQHPRWSSPLSLPQQACLKLPQKLQSSPSQQLQPPPQQLQPIVPPLPLLQPPPQQLPLSLPQQPQPPPQQLQPPLPAPLQSPPQQLQPPPQQPPPPLLQPQDTVKWAQQLQLLRWRQTKEAQQWTRLLWPVDMYCFYMPAQWVTLCSQWAAGEKMFVSSLPSRPLPLSRLEQARRDDEVFVEKIRSAYGRNNNNGTLSLSTTTAASSTATTTQATHTAPRLQQRYVYTPPQVGRVLFFPRLPSGWRRGSTGQPV